MPFCPPRCEKRGRRRDFFAALQHPARGPIALIAEVKKASPSAGVICPDFDPVRIARQYEAAGADCLSVLTDEKFFQGSLAYLRQVRAAVTLPLLRKDFIIDDRQILESIEAGADAILLIARILTGAELQQFHTLACAAGLAALVEVHDEAEMDRALSLGANLIGVNNRNLDTFAVDLGLTGRLAARIPPGAREGRVLVAESGIHQPGRCGTGCAAPEPGPYWSANPCCATPPASPQKSPNCSALSASSGDGRALAPAFRGYLPGIILAREARRRRISASSFRPRAGLPRLRRARKRASAWRSVMTCVTKLSNSLCTLVPLDRAAPSRALCLESSQR